MADENADAQAPDLEPREPTVADLRDLCGGLNSRGARYILVGGFAIRAAGYLRHTMAAVDGVEIPFASPELLWLTKKPTQRAKDAGDFFFLEALFEKEGRRPPAC